LTSTGTESDMKRQDLPRDRAIVIGGAIAGLLAGRALAVWRRYDKLEKFPSGYLVFGDAISSFNPRYGQGMSAVLQALELHKVLAEGCSNLASEFFARTAKVVEKAWTMSASNDLRMKEVCGSRSVASTVVNWYMAQLQKAAQRDPGLALAFHRVTNLLDPPHDLMSLEIALHVLKARLPWFDPMAGCGLQVSAAS